MNADKLYEGIAHADWITIVILVCIYLVWSVWRTAGGFLEQKSFEVIRGYERKSLFAYDTLSEYRVGIVLGVVHVITLSLYLYIIMRYFNYSGGLNVFLLLILAVAVYHTFKTIIVRYFHFLLDQKEKAVLWMKSYVVLNFVLGLALIPVIILYVYGPLNLKEFALNSGLFFIAIYLITLLGRSFKIFFSNLSSFIYLILYFCTFEILPLLIAVKTVL